MTPQVGIKLGIDGTAKVESELKRVSVGLDGIGKAGAAAAGMLASLGAGISIAGLVAFVRKAVDAADEMSKLSQRTGVAVKDIAGLQLAFQQSGLSADEFGTTMGRMSRNMVDNAKAFDAMGVKTKDAAGKMRSVRDVLGDVADKFKSYEDGAAKVALANEAFGKGADRLIPLLNGGREALEEFDATAQRLGLTMDETTGKQAEKFNDTMELIGMGVQGTARKIAGELLPTMVGLASQFLESMNTGDGFKKVAEGLSVALRGLYIVGLGVVNAFSSVGKTLGAAAGVIASVLKGDFASARAIMSELRADLTAGVQATIADMGKAWNAASSPAVTALSAMSAAVKTHAPEVEKGVKKVAKAAKELKDAFSEAAAKAFSKAMEDFGRISSDAAAKAEALTRTQARLRDIMADPTWFRFSRQQQEQVIAAAAAAQAAEDWAEAQEAARKAMASAADELKEYNEAQRGVVADAVAEATAAEEALRNYGLLKSQVQELTLAKLEEARVSAQLAGEDVDNIEKRIAAQKRLIDATRGLEARQVAEDAAKHAADEWQKATDQINQSLTDSLMRGFESGKGFARSLRDAVVNMFKTMVLRPVIQAIVQPIAGPIAQGLSGVLGGGVGGLGGMVGSLFGAGGLGGSLAAGAGWMTGATTFGGSLAAAGSLIGTGTMGGIMSGLGMAAGALGPIALGALALSSIFGGRRGGPKVDGSAGFTASNIGRMSADRSLSPMVATQVQQLQMQYAQIARAMGGDPGAIRFGMGVTTDPRGTAPSFLDITGINRAGGTAINLVNTNVGRSNEELQAAIAQFVATATIEGLKNSNLAPQYQAFLNTVASGASTEIKQAAVQTLLEVKRFTGAVSGMGPAFTRVGDLSVEARKRMIDFAGGIDQFMQGVSTYADNFLTTEQRRQMVAEQVAQAMRDSGISIVASQLMTYTRATIREWVQGLNMETEAGQVAFGRIMGNMQGLLAVVEANEAHWTELTDAVGSAGSEVGALAVAVGRMGMQFSYVANMSEAARQRILDLGGGLDRLSRGMSQYVDTFLSGEEQRLLLAVNLARDLQASFISVSAETLMTYTRQTIRDWVNGLDLATAGGQQVFAGLMGNMEGLVRLIQENEEALAGVSSDSDALAQAVGRLGAQFAYVADVSEAARQRILDLGGGVEQLTRGMAQYTEAFLPAEDQRRLLARNLALDLQKSFVLATEEGLLTYSRNTIRDWVNSLDLNTPQGQQAFAGIMSNMDAIIRMIEANERVWDEQVEYMKRLTDEAEKFRDALKRVGDTIEDEIMRLRGATKEGAGESLAALWARFASTTGQARAGDLDAAGKLAGLSQSIEEAVRSTASERSEVDAVREQLSGSLAATMAALNRVASQRPGIVLPVRPEPTVLPGELVGVLKPLQVQPGTATPSIPSAPTPSNTAAGADLLEQIALQQRQMTALMNRLTTTVTRWDVDGLPEERQPA